MVALDIPSECCLRQEIHDLSEQGLSITQMGMVFYVTTLLSVEKELDSLLMLVMIFMSFLLSAPVKIAARELSKKAVLTLR